MVSSIQKWGNSLAVRIPKAFAEQARLEENSTVEISIDGERITLAPAQKPWHLDALLRKISDSNLHREADWGKKRGKEAW